MSTKNVTVTQKAGIGMNSAQVESGAFDGEQVGEMFPSIIQTIQEAPGAADSSNLYYNERYGKYNQPSFQRRFGIKNSDMGNVDSWGQNGVLQIDENIFWQGPCMLRLKVNTPYRYSGYRAKTQILAGALDWCGSFMQPQFFYSHGAGYAALQEIRMNQGGAMTYVIDGYSNFHAIMASCLDSHQRYALMKLSGGGLKQGLASEESARGLSGRTEDFGKIPNVVPIKEGDIYYIGTPGEYRQEAGGNFSLHPQFIRTPIADNWLVAIKTPHTNFNNPKIRRRPIDTSLLQEPFRIEIRLSKFDYICDSGVSNPILFASAGIGVQSYTMGAVHPLSNEPSMGTDLGLYRQFQQIFPLGADPNAFDGYIGSGVLGNGVGNPIFANFVNSYRVWAQDGVTKYLTSPKEGDVRSETNIGPLLTENTLPNIYINSVISSLKLTNSNLGAFNFLSAHSEAAVYYPYQHFVSQKYLVPNVQYGGMTMKDYITLTDQNRFPSDDRNKTPLTQYINIVCNPMTAMYIGVYREKDRTSMGVSTKGGYSPCLFWNSLRLVNYEMRYGSEPLEIIDSYGEGVMNQIYEHGSTLQVPYLGGCVSKSELKAQLDSYGSGSGSGTNGGLFYPTILRNAYLYEFSMTECEPLKNEAYLQQTPSFLGENLTFSFNVKPDIDSTVFGSFNPAEDVSFLDSYIDTPGTWNLTTDALDTELTQISQADAILNANFTTLQPPQPETYPGDTLLASQKGPRWSVKGCVANPWVLNNDDNFLVSVTFAMNALWQLNPTLNQVIFGRG